MTISTSCAYPDHHSPPPFHLPPPVTQLGLAMGTAYEAGTVATFGGRFSLRVPYGSGKDQEPKGAIFKRAPTA